MEEENIQIHCILSRIKGLHIKPAAETHSITQVLGYHIGAKGKTKVRDDMSHRLVRQMCRTYNFLSNSLLQAESQLLGPLLRDKKMHLQPKHSILTERLQYRL